MNDISCSWLVLNLDGFTFHHFFTASVKLFGSHKAHLIASSFISNLSFQLTDTPVVSDLKRLDWLPAFNCFIASTVS